jgi:hypothetical protein
VCGLDEHVGRINECIRSIRRVYGKEVDIGIATFGNNKIPESLILATYAHINLLQFYDSPRQHFIPTLSESWRTYGVNCCEVIGLLSVSKHFYGLGYEHVFLIHNDLFIIRDVVKLYKAHMRGNWSFVAPFVNLIEAVTYSRTINYMPHQIKKRGVRLSQSIIIFNPLFIRDIYAQFDSDEGIWEKVLSHSDLHGDIALFDISRSFLGYSAITIGSEYFIDGRWSRDNIEQDILTKEIHFIHGPDVYNYMVNKIESIHRRIYAS